MTRRDGTWLLHLDGYPDTTADDLTLDLVELVERVAGVPYVLVNPLASVKEAKALLVALLVNAGTGEDEALAKAAKLPLRVLRSAFTYVPADDPRAPAESEPDPPA